MQAMAMPSPLNGFDLFNYMATIVCMRGTREGRDLFSSGCEELEDKKAKGLARGSPARRKIRVMWDGIACWPYLGDTYKVLKKYGVTW
jgi:benzoyl-CoA reductase/2-hydroxyglutaryl-CoA dehydratase subunit BcrC/BadD/HgdB